MVVGQLEHVPNSAKCVVGRFADIHRQLVVTVRDRFDVAGGEQDIAGHSLMAGSGFDLKRR